ncbi:NADP-dependent oxidoreductase [Gallaecimonas mangrovi]|uniref:NADP-dependent oxidoreductase n=1 Tax=Gallaecimonas mangrovi TaxID=2291597 RepID=UPI000E209F81|nr:NADP-dependent oxidoreductase [Gallaecimonas mangrovi]
MTKMMKAICQYSFGGPEVLQYQDIAMPELKPGEVLVQVAASGVNPPDWYLRNGMKELPPQWRPQITFPLVLGTDISGVVAAVAEDVTDFGVGDAVYAMVRFPEGMAGNNRGYAQYVTVPAEQLGRKPQGIDHIHAAGAPMALLTAWQFLIELGHEHPNPLQPHRHQPAPLKGKRVLINGAAGGVGHFALQLAKWQGAEVIAVASGRHQALLQALGADEVVDYTQTKAEDHYRDLDLVVDAVGGQQAQRFLPTLKAGGALFPIFSLGFDAHAQAQKLGVTVSSTQVRSHGGQLSTLAKLLDDGTVRVVIDSVYPLADAALAHKRAAQGHIQGKIVLSVS